MSLQQSRLVRPCAADPLELVAAPRNLENRESGWICCNPVKSRATSKAWPRVILEILGKNWGMGTPREGLRLNSGSAKPERPHRRSRMSADKKRTSKLSNRSFRDQKRGRFAVGVSCPSLCYFRTPIVEIDRKSSRAEAASAEPRNKKSRARLSFRASSQFHTRGTAAHFWLACWEERPGRTAGKKVT